MIPIRPTCLHLEVIFAFERIFRTMNECFSASLSNCIFSPTSDWLPQLAFAKTMRLLMKNRQILQGWGKNVLTLRTTLRCLFICPRRRELPVETPPFFLVNAKLPKNLNVLCHFIVENTLTNYYIWRWALFNSNSLMEYNFHEGQRLRIARVPRS